METKKSILWSVMIVGMLVAVPFSYAAEAPTAKKIIEDETVKAAVDKAWNERMPVNGKYQTRGGWVYADTHNPSKLIVRLADKCRSRPGTEEEAGRDPELVEIYLDYPENDHSSPQAPAEYKLVADFHTHPFSAYPRPDEDDVARAYNRKVPGLVYSCEGIFLSGPQRRASFEGPHGYPANCFEDREGQNYTQIAPTPFNCHKY